MKKKGKKKQKADNMKKLTRTVHEIIRLPNGSYQWTIKTVTL